MAPFPPLHDLLSTAAATALHTTRTLHQRQTQTTPAATTVTVVTDGSTTTNNNDSPDDAQTLSGGAIAGIVIGSVAGFLLLVWIIRSCTNLGAPPGDEAVPGRPWYGGVRDEHYPPRNGHGHGRARSRGRSRHSHRDSSGHHHHHHGHSRSRSYGGGGSRRVSVVEAVPVQEVAPVVVREGGRSRSRGYYGYGEEPVRRSRSRGRY
ncbi:hypothetical protein C8A00DRAFT_45789 [Chaetomidium leptoderma]|uniref:Uncharacterized protein n=1 Tax=Chaetomidium leptoderma TaxID=669021 RepID=A0AAN6VGJ9_9PEZI|nr:hypothetical protein C8A00DRAFT_45789 [Chaetomidium leptoderma]